jgi:hypothetical protein
MIKFTFPLTALVKSYFFQAVINLESVGRFSAGNGTQTFPPIWRSQQSKTTEELIRGGARGNFLAVTSRGTSKDGEFVRYLNDWRYTLYNL